jgi:methylenetetrahydrofolate dehydrogenase(NAD+)/5,10-methenyltetrahydrofolate cyclohydrolase
LELRDQIAEWMEKENHRAPQLTAILIGDDPASQIYVRNKMKVSELEKYFFIETE